MRLWGGFVDVLLDESRGEGCATVAVAVVDVANKMAISLVCHCHSSVNVTYAGNTSLGLHAAASFVGKQLEASHYESARCRRVCFRTKRHEELTRAPLKSHHGEVIVMGIPCADLPCWDSPEFVVSHLAGRKPLMDLQQFEPSNERPGPSLWSLPPQIL